MTEQELEAIQKDPEGTHECPKCKKPVPNERVLALMTEEARNCGLKPTLRCGDCTPQPFIPKGVYDCEGPEADSPVVVVCYEKTVFKAAKSANISIDDDVELSSEEEEPTEVKVEKQ